MHLSVKFFFILFMAGLSFPGLSRAQKTVIKGVAPGAERKIIRISTPGDLITFWDKPLATAKVDSTGHFSLTVNIDQTINSIISIDFHKTELFLEPSKTYVVRIAPMKYDDYTEVNPLIQSQNLTLELAEPDPDELNSLVGAFNSIYSGFLEQNFNALYRDRNKALLDTFRAQVNQHFGSVKNTYFLDYETYKIASLEQLTQYYNRAQLAKKYFSDRPVLYNNLEYMDFFNNFFSKFMTATAGKMRKVDVTSLLKGTDPYGTIMKAMNADTIFKSEQLRELVMLKGLMDLYNTPSYPQDEVLAVIRATGEKSKYQENKKDAKLTVSHNLFSLDFKF
jgi:hypothetical protein